MHEQGSRACRVLILWKTLCSVFPYCVRTLYLDILIKNDSFRSSLVALIVGCVWPCAVLRVLSH